MNAVNDSDLSTGVTLQDFDALPDSMASCADITNITSPPVIDQALSPEGATSEIEVEKQAKGYIECAVCGDRSSGKHYGVFTCEGCKSFFKRSVRRNLNYACRGFRDCAVDLHHRNQCQYCRLRKCFRVGMRKEAVQKGRMPTSQMDPQPPLLPGLPDMGSQSFFSSYITLLLRADTIARYQQSLSLPCSIAGLENTSELAARLLLSSVEWVKNIPFFSDFSLPDQSLLLTCCWSELFILNAAQHYSPFHVPPALTSCGLLPGANGSYEIEKNSSCSYAETLKVFQEQVDKFKNLHIDSAEFSCLKALVLFNPDSQGLSNASHVESLQERTQCALEDYIRNQYSSQPTRFGKLLLRLPSLRLVRPDAVENLFFSQLAMGRTLESVLNDFLVGNNPIMNWQVPQPMPVPYCSGNYNAITHA